MKDKEHHEKTPENLKWWISIDSAMTTSVGTNKELFHIIKTAENPTGTVSNSSELDSDLNAEMNDVGCMPFNEDGMANSFGMNDLIQCGFQVHMDSAEEIAFFQERWHCSKIHYN